MQNFPALFDDHNVPSSKHRWFSIATCYVSRGYLPTRLRMTSKPKKQRSWPSPWHMASRAGVQTAGGKTWHPRTYQWREWGYPIFTQTKGVYLWCTDVYGIWGTLCKYDLDAVWALNDWKSWMFHQYKGHVANWYTACFTHGDWVCIPGCVCVCNSVSAIKTLELPAFHLPSGNLT